MGGARKLEVRDKRGRKPGGPRMARGFAGAENVGPVKAQTEQEKRSVCAHSE